MKNTELKLPLSKTVALLDPILLDPPARRQKSSLPGTLVLAPPKRG